MSDNVNQFVSDEMLMSYADGELDESDAKVLEARIASDPKLQARYAVFAETAEVLRAALSPGPVPDRLVRVVQSELAHDESGVRLFKPALIWPLSLAAALVVGVSLGWIWQNGNEFDSPVALREVAQAMAATATGQNSDLPLGGQSRVIGTFETAQGICRLLSHVSVNQVETRFVACLGDGEWQVALSVSLGSAKTITPASSEATELIDDFLDSIGSGPALTLPEERVVLGHD